MKRVDTFPVVIPGRQRRRHDAEFKARVVKACCRPGVSIAGVALAHGLNANMLRRWLTEHGITPERRRAATKPAQRLPTATAEFVPVTVDAGPAAPGIRIELQRGNATVTVHWPTQAAADCTAWLREWLR